MQAGVKLIKNELHLVLVKGAFLHIESAGDQSSASTEQVGHEQQWL